MYKLLLLIAGALTSPLALAAGLFFPGGPGPYAVGLRVVQLQDTSRVYAGKTDLVTGMAAGGARTRPIQALVWYPAQQQSGQQQGGQQYSGTAVRYADYLRSAATEEQFTRDAAAIDRFFAAYMAENYPALSAQQSRPVLDQTMLARRDAQPLQGQFPVVIYAPGSSNAAHENADLCEYLASHGYLVIASASIGVHTRSIDLTLEGAESEARDISYLVGYAATLPQADARHVAAMGFSWGGLANVLAAARDDRITALVSLDGSVRYFPAVVQQALYATPERLALPMLYVGGKPATAEAMNRANQIAASYSLMNRMKYADLYNVTMYTMEHAAFQSEYLRFGADERFGGYTRDDALLAHGWMGRYVRAFLDAYLRNDAASLAFMRDKPAANAVPAHLLSVDVHLAEGEPPTLATLASRYAAQGHTGLDTIYRDMNRRDPLFKPDERALIAWGEQFLDQKRYGEATAIYLLVTTLYPDSGRALFYLAMTHDRNHNDAAAIAAYRRVLGIWPDEVEAKQAIERLQTDKKR